MEESKELNILPIIKKIYGYYDFTPESADYYDQDSLTLMKEIHAIYALSGLNKLRT
jgi:hypothetical protein